MSKTALITGASSGIGKATALELKSMGYTVYAAARRIENMKDLSEQGIHIVSLDVTDDASMISCVNNILNKEKSIDVLINNAGYGSFGAVEDVPMDEARRQLEVNVIGLSRMTQLVLPGMRAQRDGKIINISSMGGKMYTPFRAWYHATKFAVEALSDCLRLEVAPFGISVVVVEPGGIKTDWGTIAADHLIQSSAGGAYSASAKKAADGTRKLYSGEKLTSPEVIAKAIGKSVMAKRPKTRILLGFGAKPAVFMRRILSDRAFDKLIKLI